MRGPFRNSEFKVNTYFKRFSAELEEAKKHGHDVWANEVRKYNNCYYARKLQGGVSIKEIIKAAWPSFKEKYARLLTRPGLVKAVESFAGCHDFANGYIYYECPECGDFYMVGFSCHSRMCPSCGKKYRYARSAKVSGKCLEAPHRQFVFTVPEQLRPFFRKHRKPMLNALFAAANDAFTLLLKKHAPKAFRREGRKLGFISFLHTFGRDMKWHPHLHILIAERHMDGADALHKRDFFSFDFLRLAFMNPLLSRVYGFSKAELGAAEQRSMWLLQKELRGKYPKGYYVYGPKFPRGKTTTRDVAKLTHHIARYASHPVISEGRISSFDPKAMTVTWFYDPHEDDDVKDESEKRGAVRHRERRGLHQKAAHPRPRQGVPADKVLRLLLERVQDRAQHRAALHAVGARQDGGGQHMGQGPVEVLRLRSDLVQMRREDGNKLRSFGLQGRMRMTRYKYNFRVRHDAEWDTDYVGMKCLHCDYEEEMELDILLECSDPSGEESPMVYCLSCGHVLLVPKDVYDRIKRGFIYKPE
ncbi:transposase zinc-binding domain-containing protein [bacterium]|nr:transposase zinc-binding domain-containing protein [bacterium]